MYFLDEKKRKCRFIDGEKFAIRNFVIK